MTNVSDRFIVADLDIELAGVFADDYPDFCDASVYDGTYQGRELTDEEIDFINNDAAFINHLACMEVCGG